jgi:hypothetical protein
VTTVRRRERTKLCREFGKEPRSREAVDVDDNQPASRACCYADIRVRPTRPPFANLGFIACRVSETVIRDRFLAGGLQGKTAKPARA